jgi:CRP-like cAMP-binding protein
MRSSSEARALLSTLVDRLSRHSTVCEEERRAVCGQWRRLENHPVGAGIGGDGEPRFLVTGWACRLRRLPGGHSQLVAFLVPGDLATSAGYDDPFETRCLTQVETIGVGPLTSRFVSGAPTHPDLAGAIRTAETRAANLVFDHLVRLGAMTAREGLAHLLLEFHRRMGEAGLVVDGRFTIPVGQRRLGEAMGLSAVHVNTTLKQFRADGLIEHGPGWLCILDNERLSRVAQSVPSPIGFLGLGDLEPPFLATDRDAPAHDVPEALVPL